MVSQTIGDLLQEGATILSRAGIETARLDMLLFLEDVSNSERAYILAHPEYTLEPSKIDILSSLVKQRTHHIPIAYIRGKAAFFGRDFIVTPSVLVPRPETETMLEMLLDIRSDLSINPTILDIGTGSGCLGITAALEIPDARIFLTDIDSKALQVAIQNTEKYRVTVSTQQTSLLTDLNESFEVLLCNLPYVPTAYPVNKAATHEPSIALFAGDDGLALYQTFWQQVANKVSKPAHIFTESLQFQHEALEELASAAGYTLAQTKDLIQHFTPAEV